MFVTWAQVPGPDPTATIRGTVLFQGAVMGQFYLAADAAAWLEITGHPAVHTGHVHEHSGLSSVRYEWIGPYTELGA